MQCKSVLDAINMPCPSRIFVTVQIFDKLASLSLQALYKLDSLKCPKTDHILEAYNCRERVGIRDNLRAFLYHKAKTPFVLGTSLRPVKEIASLRAKASALKADSAR